MDHLFRVKKFSTVVMDGTNRETLKRILDIVWMWADGACGEIKCHALDKNHPSMVVIESKMYTYHFNQMRSIIEANYPGLCIFNPPMKV